MNLPSAIVKKSREARELHAQLFASDQQDAPDTTDSGLAEPVVDENLPVPPDEPVVTESADSTPKASPEDDGVSESPDSWEHRFKMLRSARDERRAKLEAEVTGLQQQLELAEQRTAVETPPQPTRFELDDETRGELDERDAEAIERLGNHVNERFDQLDTQRNEEAKRLDELFFDDLSVHAPKWVQLNDDPQFLAWLDTVDTDVGVMRRAAFNALTQERNVSAVAGMINSYLSSQKVSQAQTPATAASISPEPQSTRSAPVGETEKMVEIYHPDEVKEFYAHKNLLLRQGRLRNGVPKEIAEQEEKIRQAIRENRVSAD